jgi:hypothetical protein
MARKRRVFREWQHPRDGRGRFTDGAGTASWVDRAEKAFKAVEAASPSAASTRGDGDRPRISRAAKGAALFTAQREGARPSRTAPVPAATKSAAPAVKNLTAFNAKDSSKLPAKKLAPKTRGQLHDDNLDRVARSSAGQRGAFKPSDQDSMRGMSDERLENALVMLGNQSDRGKAVQAELNRRKLEKARASEASAPARENPWADIIGDAERHGYNSPSAGKTAKSAPMSQAEREDKLRDARASEAAALAEGRKSGITHLSPEGRAKIDAENRAKLNEKVDTPRDSGQAGGMTPATAERPFGSFSKPNSNMKPSDRDGEAVEIRAKGAKDSGVVVGRVGTEARPGDMFADHGQFLVVRHGDGTFNTYDARVVHSAGGMSTTTQVPDGVKPTDGRPDVSALMKMQGRSRDYDLGASKGRDRSAAPDIIRAGNGVMDGQPASAEVKNPVDGNGDYRYRIYNDQTGATLEEGTGRDLADVKAKVDRMYSSQRGGGMARTKGNEVHYEARQTERKKDPSRGDFGKGPFYDHEVVEVRKDGSEHVRVKTSSASRAEAQAADMNAKEGVTSPAKPAARKPIGADAKRAALNPPLSDEQRGNYDKLLGDGPLSVKHKQSRQIVEQMEAHGWSLNGNAPSVGLLSFKAPDGRQIGVQFLVGEYSSKPRFFTGDASRGRDMSYKAALAHVVTPTHEEVGGGSVSGAMERAGLPDINKSYSDHTLRPLRDAQQAHTGYGTMRGPTKDTAEVAADLRKAAAQNRVVADQRKAYNDKVLGGNSVEDDSSRLLRQRADEFEKVADELAKMDAERKTYEAERDRRAALPLDIRPGRTPAKKAAPAKPKPVMQQISDKIGVQRGEAAATGHLPATPDHLGLNDEPTDGDVQRQIRAMSTRVEVPTPGADGPGGYANMKRHTLLSLARAAGVKTSGRTNTDIAADLHQRDMDAKAARTARLNPGAVGEPSDGLARRHQTEQAAAAARPGTQVTRLQTFTDRMAGDMSSADRLNAHLEGERHRQELRAQEAERARQAAEARANDTRSEREKLTEQLNQDRAVLDIDRRTGRTNPKRDARIRAAENRLAELDTEDRKAKLKTLGVVKGDRVKTAIGEFEVTGKTADGYLRVQRPDGRRGSVDPKNVEGVTKSPKA